jgi:uncharacterized protein YqeY
MTTLYETIGAARNAARKEGKTEIVTCFGTLLGEAKQLATKKENRDPTDEEVLGIIKKTLEGIAEMLKFENNDLRRWDLLFERDLLQAYMPTQLSDTEIEVIIANAQLDNIGKIMAVFKNNYLGKYDGRAVKTAAEKYIASLK